MLLLIELLRSWDGSALAATPPRTNLKSDSQPTGGSEPLTARGADIAKGKEMFKMLCASCHGEGGKGDGPGGKGLTPPPLDFTKSQFKFDADKNGRTGEDADLKAVISQGAAAFGGSPLMTPWAGALTDADIDNVVGVIRSLAAK